ncbi:hypothetical protein [Naasia lichenicola]|uniref:Uncharacterized protein n=1 Tax=Naasia lichenicola TaxID=2565933 RepID=A0A4S4FHL1_9MICO|nr:hypothetical protein [Naasia lichenicola]THG29292.1 hypothetical protein E6C64_11260 [Naasia lichenicola]
MTAYSDWSLSSGDWLNGLNPLLTQEASEELSGTEPNWIPHDLGIESVVLDAGASAAGAVAVVTTKQGQYRVLLVRDADRWLVAHIATPDAAQ